MRCETISNGWGKDNKHDGLDGMIGSLFFTVEGLRRATFFSQREEISVTISFGTADGWVD
jgi:hypothetical protein